MKIKTKANLKCPICGFVQEVEMPQDSCQYFYQCINCKTLLKPKESDCCISVLMQILCPPMQKKD